MFLAIHDLVDHQPESPRRCFHSRSRYAREPGLFLAVVEAGKEVVAVDASAADGQ